MLSVPRVVPALLLVLPFVWGFAASDDFGSMPTAMPIATSASDGDAAAARHAKRTACIKEAKARKLLEPKKSAFIKDCIAAP